MKLHHGNFNSKLGTLNSLAVQEFHWWFQHIPKACRYIDLPKTDFTIYTDASELGWGATDRFFPTGERWDTNELSHINFLELKAAFLAFNRYYRSWKGSRHIRIKSDNTTAIVYLNNMGGSVSEKCNILSKKIRDLFNENGCWFLLSMLQVLKGFGIWKTRACDNCTPRHERQGLWMCEKLHATHQLGMWWCVMIIPFRRLSFSFTMRCTNYN